MNTDNGRIYRISDEAEAKQRQVLQELLGQGKLKGMQVPPTPRQLARTPPRVGKYDPCPCGSGKKFKFCCYTGNRYPLRGFRGEG